MGLALQGARRLGLVAALMTAGCSSFRESAPTFGGWGTATQGTPSLSAPPAPASGTSLQARAPAAPATYVDGTGRFVGVPPERLALEADAGSGITLNLVNVPVAQAAKTVLGDIMAAHYTVDPSVSGSITLQTPRPVPRAVVLDLFQTALRASNAAVTDAGGGMYRIVPADQALTGARIAVGGRPPVPEMLGARVQVVQLRYVAADEMKRILDPLAPRGGVVRADKARNTLTLSGTAQDMAGMMEAIAIFDVDVMKGMSFAMVPVKTSSPATIAGELEKIFSTGEEGPMAGMVKFLPNKRLGAVLIVSPQPRYIARAEGWVRRLDAQASGREKQFYTYKVQNRRAQELVEVLRSIFSSDGGSSRGTRQVTPRDEEATLASKGSGNASSSFGSGSSTGGGFSLGGARQATTARNGEEAEEASGEAAQLAIGDDAGAQGAAIKVAADTTKNAILIEATPADYARVMRVMETLDVMPNQVLIEATIVEVGLNDTLQFGVQWYIKNKGSSNISFADAAAAAGSAFAGFSYTFKAADLLANLQALSEITDVNIVSSPSLTVLDNKTATLQIGDQVPITTQSSTGTDSTSAIVNSVSYKDTGVILAITPRINETGRVLLDVEQEVSSVVKTTSSGIDSPTIRQRRVKTTVMVNDGEPIALGGLIQAGRTKGRTQIPLVGDLPVIGSVFQQKTDEATKTELIILITPRVMRNVEEARAVTEELKREFAAQVWRTKRGRAPENTVRRLAD